MYELLYLQLTILRSCIFYFKTMLPRFKKVLKVIDQRLDKEEFLKEHNRLSPENLKATDSLLCRFKAEKASLFRGDSWSIDKLRRPFVLWLTSQGKEGAKKVS